MSGLLQTGDIDTLLTPHGLITRGAITFKAGEGPVTIGGRRAVSVVLIGHAGSSFWEPFTAWREGQEDRGGSDPLDAWSKTVIGAIASDFDASAYFPSDQPYQPFQRWAKAAEALEASPLGILIHPRFGLWHGYRGALGFQHSVTESRGWQASASPCVSCEARPCISSCPAAALAGGSMNVAGCRTYLATPAGQGGCMTTGCAARAACPVGTAYQYREEQVRFHMQALKVPAE